MDSAICRTYLADESLVWKNDNVFLPSKYNNKYHYKILPSKMQFKKFFWQSIFETKNNSPSYIFYYTIGLVGRPD